ncbi:metal-dependent hydrolase [Brevibacillus thermoruber]|uniref:Metal-dependent hydrolase n=1 Tax=Brevibacillus thermoruber TaxID=33942 RepID=A0A9X3TUW1_9BACL|nr:metal-dependent hydrolase [Brevibacillus thermoruber]MDA5110878.1 metal-dependent hydrolase [Brevibacillus thermoruber]
MLGRTHMTVAVAAYCSYKLPHQWDELPLWVMGLGTVIFTSLLPDITEPRSRMGGMLMPFIPSWLRPFVFLVVGGMLVYYGWGNHELLFMAIGVVLLLLVLVKNRESPTHGFVGIGVVVAFAWLYQPNLWMPALIGYSSHLALDFISEKITLFSPLSSRRFGVTLFQTGSTAERLIVQWGAIFYTAWITIQSYLSI